MLTLFASNTVLSTIKVLLGSLKKDPTGHVTGKESFGELKGLYKGRHKATAIYTHTHTVKPRTYDNGQHNTYIINVHVHVFSPVVVVVEKVQLQVYSQLKESKSTNFLDSPTGVESYLAQCLMMSSQSTR